MSEQEYNNIFETHLHELRKWRKDTVRAILIASIPVIFAIIGIMIKMYSDIQLNKQKIQFTDSYYTRLMTIIDRRTAVWEDYIIANEKDKKELRQELGDLEDELIEIYKKYSDIPRNKIQELENKFLDDNI